MYLADNVTGPALEKAATAKKPFGPGFQPEHLKNAVRMEIWCSNITDLGEDHTDFKLIDKDGKVLFTSTVGGF